MTESEFQQLAARGFNRIPLARTLPADLDTPLSVYLKLAGAPFSYLLESVVGGERFGRYSFIGLPAREIVEVRGRSVRVLTDGTESERHDDINPLDFLRAYQARFRAAPAAHLPRFSGGLAGYFGYDTIRHVEKKLAHADKHDAIGTPDMLLLLTEELAVYDNLAGRLTLITHADPCQPGAYCTAQARLDALAAQLQAPLAAPDNTPATPAEPRSEFGAEAFKAAVMRAKEYIAAGDIMQVVLSQRMSRPYDASALTLYRRLRALNPSPYMFYYDFGAFHVVGASPEILVRLEGDGAGDGMRITLRPIAGTRPRGATREADQALEGELLADPKERAEHLQLLDLGRNDVGRVAEIGSVRVTENMIIERYSHVMHIVSNVEGRLRPGLSALDVLAATFPAGTVSGAPKIRAMEIIDELEPGKRGVYAGSVGYLAFSGDMDLAIAIRTAVLKDGTLYVQAGAGIVADSVPDSEWAETQNKARALLRAAELS